MKKIQRSVLFSALLLLITVSAAARQKPVIAIFALENPTDKAWIDNLGSAVTDTVYLSLALMGRYETRRPETPSPKEEDLSALATREGYDDVIIGRCLKTESGYRIDLTVYDRHKDRIVYRGVEEFESIFDSFDVADRITEALVEQISGVNVTYGSLIITSEGNEPYRTEIDGVDMGEGFSGLEKIISGYHFLKFFQNRNGMEELVAVHEVVIDEGVLNTLNRPLPWLTQQEALNFRIADLHITAALNEPKNDAELENAFAQALELASTPFLSEWRSSITNRYTAWKASFDSGLDSAVYESRSYQRSSNNWLGSKMGRELIASPEELTASSAPELLIHINQAREGNNPAVIWLSEADIKVDGKKDDWAGVETTWNDDLNDGFIMSREFTSGRNITWAAAATDGERLYLAMEILDGEYGKELTYDFDVFGMHLITFRMDKNDNEWHYYGHRIKGRNWDTARSFETSVNYKAKAGEIIEMSYPLKLVEEWVESHTGYGRVDFAVQLTNKPYTVLDVYDIVFALPSMYYAVRSE